MRSKKDFKVLVFEELRAANRAENFSSCENLFRSRRHFSSRLCSRLTKILGKGIFAVDQRRSLENARSSPLNFLDNTRKKLKKSGMIVAVRCPETRIQNGRLLFEPTHC